MPDLLLALDQGTTSSRSVIFDRAGRLIALAQEEFPQLYPQPGWVEHDPEAIWRTQLATAQSAMRQAGVTAGDLAAIGITNQRETTIVWDRHTGTPIYNAIVWQCRRTAAMCDRLRAEGFDRVLSDKTGLVTDPYFSGTKLAWILDHVPDARIRASHGELAFGTVDTFLLWKLTGGALHATDVSNASRTLLFNIHTLEWDAEILEYLRIPVSLLPKVHPSAHVYGETDAGLLGASVPIGGIAGDQQAAAFGQACFTAGMAKNTYGTGCFLLLNTGEDAPRSTRGLLTTIGWSLAAQTPGARATYCLEGSIFVAGAAVQWLRDGLHLIDTSAEVEGLARSEADNGGVYLVPAFTGLGAPYWDAYARGTIVGLTRGSTSGHLARATLESIAYQTYDVIQAMQGDAHLALQALRVDGGASRNDLLMQFQADLLGVPVQRPVVTETTALGAAYLAGLGVKVWQATDEIAGQWQLDREYLPSMSDDHREGLLAVWHRAVDRARSWAVD
jgi:glycerol kinase